MSKIDYAMFVKIVAVVFSISAITAFTFAMLRLLHPELFYPQELTGSILVLHYLVCGLTVSASGIGLVNSVAAWARGAGAARAVTLWLLLDSVFETARVLYLFAAEVLLRGGGTLHMYDMVVGGAQYLLDSLLYCQVILKRQ